MELPPPSRLPAPGQDQTDALINDISLAVPFHLWASQTLPAGVPAMRKEKQPGSWGNLAVEMGREAVLKHRDSEVGRPGGGGAGGGVWRPAHIPSNAHRPFPFPASGNLFLATVLPGPQFLGNPSIWGETPRCGHQKSFHRN